ncbi:MAG TPA: glycoside hydrolase family 3 protein [Candidatus Limnocylindrales bacterium]|nr:glycoside hydrolase family 3 protein [Candidatus Limnocylindrales bacterium]
MRAYPALSRSVFVGLAVISLLATGTVAAVAAPGCTSVADCLSKMTLAEKAGQMTQVNHTYVMRNKNDIATYGLGSLLSGGGSGPGGAAGGTATAWADMYDDYQSYALRSRLGIPLLYGVDAVHGHSNVLGATIFPHNIGLGATRDVVLAQQVQQVTRTEVLGTGIDWTFAPCVCAPRDDRWGRTYEGFGEVPAIVGPLGKASVQGLQGASLTSSTIVATAKHYVGDGGTEGGDDQGDTRISETELRAIHLAPYQDAIAGGVGSIMISYSSWNGVKMHEHGYLINNVLKGELGFDGVVLSDWGGVKQIPGASYAERVRKAINAGIDMIMVPDDYQTNIASIVNEVNAGRISMARIDDAVARILRLKFSLDLFNKPFTDRTYTALVGSQAHRDVARQAVRQSLVLLKNNNVLPLSLTDNTKIVVGGKTANNLGYQLGGWSITWQGGSGDTTTGTTFWEAIQQATTGTNIQLQYVGTQTKRNYSGDIGIWVGGETPYAEGQGDSSTLALSSADKAHLSDICARTTVCIAILVSGRPLIINDALSMADAFVAAWLPGTEGAGMTDVLFGQHNFTGKLPVTWPSSVTQEPINDSDGKTPLFSLGYGLTY